MIGRSARHGVRPDSDRDADRVGREDVALCLVFRGRVAGSYGASVGVRLAWLSPAGCREGGASW